MGNPGGFTLAEVMVAMLFLSIAVFAYFALHLRIIHSASTLEQRQSMRRHVERAHASQRLGPRPPKLGTFPLNPPESDPRPSQPSSTQPDYEGNVTITLMASPPGLYRVETSLFWNNPSGRQQYLVDSFLKDGDPGW